MEIVATATDTARWWGSVGALLAVFLIIGWVRPWSAKPPKVLPASSRFLAGCAMVFAMLSIFLAGGVIPWATDGRAGWFDEYSLTFAVVMCLSWMGWGLSAWLCAVALSDWKRMVPGSMAMLMAMYFASIGTVGGAG